MTTGTFDAADPRSRLVGGLGDEPASGEGSGDASFVEFQRHPPAVQREGMSTWYARAQNFVVGYSVVTQSCGVTTERPDEWMLLLPSDDLRAWLSTDCGAADLQPRTLTIVPPGAAQITFQGRGDVVQVMTSRSDLEANAAANAEMYMTPAPSVAPLELWPSPPGGHQVRSYSLDVPADPTRFGRIWRCRGLMVNVLDPLIGPRDPTKLSPHAHSDFEQGSLALSGEYIHHIRWPWGPDGNSWKDDLHQRCGSPSLAVIPAATVHTSQAVAPDANQLVDIFAPPRRDFSQQPGWVLNADEYPVPATSEAEVRAGRP